MCWVTFTSNPTYSLGLKRRNVERRSVGLRTLVRLLTLPEFVLLLASTATKFELSVECGGATLYLIPYHRESQRPGRRAEDLSLPSGEAAFTEITPNNTETTTLPQ